MRNATRFSWDVTVWLIFNVQHVAWRLRALLFLLSAGTRTLLDYISIVFLVQTLVWGCNQGPELLRGFMCEDYCNRRRSFVMLDMVNSHGTGD